MSGVASNVRLGAMPCPLESDMMHLFRVRRGNLSEAGKRIKPHECCSY